MSHQGISNPPPRISGVGAVLRQGLLLAITVLVSVTLVVLLTMARRDQYELNARDRASFGDAAHSYPALVADYLGGLLHGQLSGASTTPIKRRVMNQQIVDSGRRSLELLLVSMAVALPLGLLWGALIDALRGKRLGALLFAANTLAQALPSFLLLLLLLQTVSSITASTGVRLAYTQGYGFDRHLIVPVAVLGLRGGAYFAQVVASAQQEIARQEWLQVARAKGLGGLRLWRQHVLPLLYLPLLGGVLGTLRVLVGAMILVEYLYNWSGLSKLLLQINAEGVLTYKPEPVEVGAAVLLALFFVATDALGRLALWGSSVQRHERGAA